MATAAVLEDMAGRLVREADGLDGLVRLSIEPIRSALPDAWVGPAADQLARELDERASDVSDIAATLRTTATELRSEAAEIRRREAEAEAAAAAAAATSSGSGSSSSSTTPGWSGGLGPR